MSYKKRVSSNPDVWEAIELVDIAYGDYIETTKNGRVSREAWQKDKPAPVVALIKTTPYSEFILSMGDVAYDTLTTSTSRKAKWIVAAWERTGVIDPNDSRQLAALTAMEGAGIISDALFLSLTT